jgi:osmotically inducible lipoprotein OsmB
MRNSKIIAALALVAGLSACGGSLGEQALGGGVVGAGVAAATGGSIGTGAAIGAAGNVVACQAEIANCD